MEKIIADQVGKRAIAVLNTWGKSQKLRWLAGFFDCAWPTATEGSGVTPKWRWLRRPPARRLS